MWQMIFPTLSRIRVERISQTGRHVFVHTVQGRLVAAECHQKHPGRCPKLTPDHNCRRRMLADKLENWNYLLSYVIFDDESRVSLYHAGRRAHKCHLFLG